MVSETYCRPKEFKALVLRPHKQEEALGTKSPQLTVPRAPAGMSKRKNQNKAKPDERELYSG